MKKFILTVFISIYTFLLISNIQVSAYGWGFKKNNNNETPEIGKYAKILDGNDAYYVGDKSSVYLTFDVGYDEGTLEGYLDILDKENVKATFFVTGDFVERFTPLVCKIIEKGHLIGNHSYSHRKINTLSSEELLNDIEKLEKVFYNKTGQEMGKIFRPPEGQFDEKSLLTLKKAGYKTFFWSIAHVDWKGTDVNSYRSVIDNLHDGAIILLHTVSKNNLENLSDIIHQIKEKGYKLSTLEEI